MNERLKFLYRSAKAIGSLIPDGFKRGLNKRIDFSSQAEVMKEKEKIALRLNPMAYELGFEVGFQTALMVITGAKPKMEKA